mgnify:CR=1 FL=1
MPPQRPPLASASRHPPTSGPVRSRALPPQTPPLHRQAPLNELSACEAKASSMLSIIHVNPYGFNYHSVKSLNKIKIEGEQPLHENDKSSVRTPIKPSIKSTEKDAGIPKDTNELFRTKPRDIPSYPHKFRYPINV